GVHPFVGATFEFGMADPATTAVIEGGVRQSRATGGVRVDHARKNWGWTAAAGGERESGTTFGRASGGLLYAIPTLDRETPDTLSGDFFGMTAEAIVTVSSELGAQAGVQLGLEYLSFTLMR